MPGPDDGLRAGLVWAGQARPHLAGFDVVDGRRSMALATLAPFGWCRAFASSACSSARPARRRANHRPV
ncbi:MAG: hypothetical protein WDN25_16715 [Acetobacteraceae bacterium]